MMKKVMIPSVLLIPLLFDNGTSSSSQSILDRISTQMSERKTVGNKRLFSNKENLGLV